MRLKVYSGIPAFIDDNALDKEDASEEWFFSLVQRERVEKQAEKELRSRQINYGKVNDATIEAIRFASGRKYRVGDNSYYAEVQLEGTGSVRVQMVSLVYYGPDIQSHPSRVPSFFSPSEGDFISVPIQYPTQYPSTLRVQDVGYSTPDFQQDYSATFVKDAYHVEFELKLSLRIVDQKLIALETDSLQVRTLSKLPS